MAVEPPAVRPPWRKKLHLYPCREWADREGFGQREAPLETLNLHGKHALIEIGYFHAPILQQTIVRSGIIFNRDDKNGRVFVLRQNLLDGTDARLWHDNGEPPPITIAARNDIGLAKIVCVELGIIRNAKFRPIDHRADIERISNF